MPTRRDLLRAAAAGLTLPLWPGLARAAAGPYRVILVTAYGGWDTSYTIDPKDDSPWVDGPDLDEDTNVPDDRETLRERGELRWWSNPVRRPAMDALLDGWADRLLLVNGVWVGSIAHDECKLRVLTGTNDGRRADLAAISGAGLGSERALPYLDLGGTGYVGPLAAMSGTVGASQQLGTLLDRDLPRTGPGGRRYPLYHPTGDDADAIAAYLSTTRAGWADQHRGLGTGGDRPDALLEAARRADQLRTEAAPLRDALVPGAATSFEAQVDLALRLTDSGLTHSLTLDTRLTWDTHTDNADQHTAWQALGVGLRRLLDGLDSRGSLDQTAVIVLSDMTRTPKRNSQGGKDHWPVTSAMLFGGPFAGGRVLGGTDDRVDAVPVDLRTGRPDPRGAVLRYDQLTAGLLAALDVDPGPWLPGVEALGGLTD